MLTVRATADGLKPAAISLNTISVQVEDGLSKRLPSEGLPSRLERGATPLTPSYTVVRKAIPVQSATAGSNENNVKYSYDDKERTDWANDGQLSTAWVEYDLGKEVMVDEINLKLNNCLAKLYPLVITACHFSSRKLTSNKGECLVNETYTKAREGIIRVRGEQPVATRYGIVVKDQWVNTSDTITRTLTRLKKLSSKALKYTVV